MILILQLTEALSHAQKHMISTISVCDIEDIVSNFQLNQKPVFKENEVNYIRTRLLHWYEIYRRKLPWRGDESSEYSNISPDKSAYGTWVSEIMLQQTRVETVIPYWFRWLEKFPTIHDLARATPDEVNLLWAGLGYYRRGQMLLKGAQQIVKDNNGIIPDTIQDLLEVPGIGPYTAGAIASIAFNKVEPLVDGNVIRVFSRLKAITNDSSNGLEKICWALASQLIHPTSPGDFNQALMDLGATICKPTSPSCAVCPLQQVCHAYILCNITTNYSDTVDGSTDSVSSNGSCSSGTVKEVLTSEQKPLPASVTAFPYKVVKAKPKEFVFSVGVVSMTAAATTACDRSGSDEHYYLFVRRPNTGLLARQWEFPSVLLPPLTEAQPPVSSDPDPTEDMLPPSTRSEESLWPPLLVCLEEDLGLTGLSEADEGCLEAGSSVQPPQLPSEPIVHVFSHQKHTMYLTRRHVTRPSSSCPMTWTSSCAQKREVRWMTLDEVESLGVTTGVKKIISVIKNSNITISTSSKNNKKSLTPKPSSVTSKSKNNTVSSNTTTTTGNGKRSRTPEKEKGKSSKKRTINSGVKRKQKSITEYTTS